MAVDVLRLFDTLTTAGSEQSDLLERSAGGIEHPSSAG
jgi:hypothetical protein